MASEMLTRALGIMLALGLSAVLAGCGGKPSPGDETPPVKEFDVTADAYLFDARVTFEGRPSSVRLEIYYTDTLVGIGGRGYLGKGALKGWLTEDSLLVYFPSSNDYVHESIEHLLQSEKCPDAQVSVPLAGLLTTLPESLELAGDIRVSADRDNPDKPEYVVTAGNCPWRIELSYSRENTRWEVDNFSFDNGSNISITARRRTVKHDATVSSKRFAVSIPRDARRIAP